MFNSKNEYREEIARLKQIVQEIELKNADLGTEKMGLEQQNSELTERLSQLESEHRDLATQAKEKIKEKSKEKSAIAKN